MVDEFTQWCTEQIHVFSPDIDGKQAVIQHLLTLCSFIRSSQSLGIFLAAMLAEFLKDVESPDEVC